MVNNRVDLVLITMSLSTTFCVGAPMASTNSLSTVQIEAPVNLMVSAESLTWEQYASRYTLSAMSGITQCLYDQSLYRLYLAENPLVIPGPHTERGGFAFPIDKNNRSEVARAKSRILYHSVLGKPAAITWVIMSVRSRAHVYEQALSRLEQSGVTGDVYVIEGQQPGQKLIKGKGNHVDADGHRLRPIKDKEVVSFGYIDYILPVVKLVGSSRRYIFMEDDVEPCWTDPTEMLKDADRAPLMWLGYSKGGGWGAQMWSLSADALPIFYHSMGGRSGHFDRTFLADRGAPRSMRSWATTFNHVGAQRDEGKNTTLFDHANDEDNYNQHHWNCSAPNHYEVQPFATWYSTLKKVNTEIYTGKIEHCFSDHLHIIAST